MFDTITFTQGQKEDSAKLLRIQHGLVWNDVGTGKTLTTMRTMYMAGHKRCVVVCPPTAAGMWEVNLAAHMDMGDHVLNIRAGRDLTGKQIALIRSGHYLAIVVTFSLCNNAAVRSTVQEFLRYYEAALIVDEADYCKNVEAKRTQYILGATAQTGRSKKVLTKDGYKNWEIPPDNSFALCAAEIYELTGTPVGRYWDDLYAQLAPVRMDMLKDAGVETYSKFRSRFCWMKDMRVGSRIVTSVGGNRTDNIEELRSLLRECNYVRRLIDDELPPPKEYYTEYENPVKPMEYPGNYSPEQVERELKKPDSPFAKEYREVGVAFADEAARQVARAMAEEPVLVGFMHLDVGNKICRHLKEAGFRVELVQGSVGAKERDLIRDKFNAGELDGIIGQMVSMKTSWNLQEYGSHVMIVEPNPSPGTVHQFVGRVRRKGQQRQVTVEHMLVDHPLIKAVNSIRLNKLRDNYELFDKE